MSRVSDEKLQELHDRVDIVAVVQRRVQLKKSGHDWKGLCPFHGEKTPSFYVVPDKKFFTCFGCGAKGDAIKFLMQLEGKSFREALEALAQEAGISLEPTDPEEARRSARRAALAEVNEKACKFYEQILWEHPLGKVARDHLAKRGISQETAKKWRLGYAPNRWDSLAKSLEKKKVDPKLVEEAGLGVPRKKAEGLYDRFRGRLTIPIREAGRILGFGGRLLEGESDAKYLNSPETPLYNKGGVLFALDRAREAIRREGVALFVEGYFDAIGLHQAGIETPVATCGTSLGERHLELVSRAGAKEVVFVFDGDAAGLRAAQRSSELAAAQGVAARVLVPPNGEDPDETVARIGTDAFRKLVAGAQPSIEFLLDRALGTLREGASVEERVRTVESVAGIVRAAPNALARDLYLEKVAQKIGAPADTVRMAIESPAPARSKAQPSRQDTAPQQQRGPQRQQGPEVPSQPVRGRGGAQADASRQSASTKPSQPARVVPLASAAAKKAELHIVARMLRSVELCQAVEQAGATDRFTHAGLREVAEAAFDQVRHGALDAEALVQAAEPAELREALLRTRAEIEAAGPPASADDERKRLLLAVQKHARMAGEAEVLLRKQRPSAAVQTPSAPPPKKGA